MTISKIGVAKSNKQGKRDLQHLFHKRTSLSSDQPKILNYTTEIMICIEHTFDIRNI